MLQQIIAEAKQLEADAIKAESDAQKAYETFVKDTNASIEEKNRDITNKSGEKAQAEADKTAAEQDLEAANNEQQQNKNENADLHKSCESASWNGVFGLCNAFLEPRGLASDTSVSDFCFFSCVDLAERMVGGGACLFGKFWGCNVCGRCLLLTILRA